VALFRDFQQVQHQVPPQPTAATAGELFELTVSDAQGVYTVRIDMTIHAAPERVYAVLTDYGQLHRLNPTITESERLPESGTGRVRLGTVWYGVGPQQLSKIKRF